MATVEKMPMLQMGYDKLNTQLRELKAERPLIVDAIEEARAHGDLSENAEYHAAKERQGQVEATISDLEDKLSRAQIIDPKSLSGDKVVFGPYSGSNTVKVDGEELLVMGESEILAVIEG